MNSLQESRVDTLVASVTLVLFVSSLSFAAETARRSPKVIENSLGIRFVPIEPGEFEMGSPEQEPGRRESEFLHRVKLLRGFYIGTHEISQKQFRELMGSNPSAFSATGQFRERVKEIDTDTFPVESVSWHEAVEFCRRLTELPAEKKAGRTYRLPTEAEWEFASRGGCQQIWHFGPDVKKLNDHAWNSATAKNRTHPNGTRQPNQFGLHDMYGNVWEWCSDWYDADFYKTSAKTNPRGPSSGTSRVIRGGGWFSKPARCRSATRGHDPPAVADPDTGFRIVMEVESGE